ncbi:LuxR family two component transcriptional regulator [Dokdonia sp. Hel_I_63]|jgi:DNA-binding NarL/FixJ family response regulator|uniref:response regulator n=1 Tax=unclassified Dokdonia TaxID=2615033 RepID=UPI00020A78E3|nr:MULTISPECIES: response regulator transcription factor [unclassified Dokdonia]AEE19859.1 two component transcriptional regulator, LuxR family [Dokdonia sp. 4H-3-7-5]TVZ23923.1 LuxR family two component transcriptional regulator [Dokdonia sp. Hel_I_63]|tara:strand:+ start:78855 stop:79493 length:639 start_codon:yes stop_codon:yes gene_type:complete
MNKVLIADHHPITRKGITSILLAEGNYEVIGHVNDGNDLLNTLTTTEIDILILEIDIPNLNSITALKAIKREFPHIKILVLSCHPEEMYALSAIKYGASGYVAKTASIQRVLNAINQVQRGGIYLNEALSQRLVSDGNATQGLAFKYKKLSSREIEVLNLLSNGKRNKEIAAELDINEKTVSTYKMRLLKKLEAQNVAELIKHARLLQSSHV